MTGAAPASAGFAVGQQPAGLCDDSPGLALSFLVLILLFSLITGLAGSVEIKALRAQFHRKMGICCGLCCQFFLMPLIGFIVVSIGVPDDHVGLSLMILCSSSGGAYSNWWCSLFNADLALSVAMTAVSTLCSAVMLPLNLTLYTTLLNNKVDADFPWSPLFQSVGTVCAAIFVGIVICSRWPHLRKTMQMVGNASGVCMVILTIIVSLTGQRGSQDRHVVAPWSHRPGFYVIIVAPFCVALVASVMISSLRCLGLERPERVAITVEVSYQNIGISSAVAIATFCHDPRKQAEAATVPLIYGLVEAISLAIFCLAAWKADWTYASSKDSFFSILRGDYQPQTPIQGYDGEDPVSGTPTPSSATTRAPDGLEAGAVPVESTREQQLHHHQGEEFRIGAISTSPKGDR